MKTLFIAIAGLSLALSPASFADCGKDHKDKAAAKCEMKKCDKCTDDEKCADCKKKCEAKKADKKADKKAE